MTEVVYYMVRCKANGVILPEKTCSSHFEFRHQPRHLTPRLFRNQRAAQCCINAWGSGVWEREEYTESEGWEHPSYTVISEPYPKTGIKRDKFLLEAIPVTLIF